MENLSVSIELHTRAIKQTKSLLFDVSALWQKQKFGFANWSSVKKHKAICISMELYKAGWRGGDLADKTKENPVRTEP